MLASPAEFLIMKVKIYIPVSDRWSVSFGGRKITRNTAYKMFRLMEARLPKMIKKYGKLSVRVIYPDGYDNETIKSDDVPYLVYATSCFIEDYLSEATLKRHAGKWLRACRMS